MWPGLSLGPSHNSRVACCFSKQQQNKTVKTVNSGIFGAFSKVCHMQENISLKEYLFSTLVDFFTFIDFSFLRDWSHVKITFCAGYHQPV